MKKMMLLAAAALFAFAGCKETQSEKSTEVQKPVEAAQPVAQKVPAASQVAERIGVQSIDWQKAIELNAAGGLYVDVRTPQELSEGFAPYAVNIPLNDLKARFGELPKDKDLLVYCRSGRRSEIASKFLMDNGYTRVYNVLGGFNAFPKNN